MNKQLFPFELVNPNAELLYARQGQRSYLLYWVLVGGLLLTLAALPLIKVDVSVMARGKIIDAQATIPVMASLEGRVLWHRVAADQEVKKGETLLILDDESLRLQEEQIQRQINELTQQVNDLIGLLASPGRKLALQTSLYQQHYTQYQHQISLAEAKKVYTRELLTRAQKLYDQEVIARAEYEKALFENNLAEREEQLIEQQQRETWEVDQRRINREIVELRGQVEQIRRKKANYSISAPVAGVLLDPIAIEPGSFVFPGQPIAKISSQEKLLAELSIPASRMGYICEGTPVKVHLDAYNFHEWGAISGVVTALSTEVQLIDNQPVLLARVSLDRNGLQLKNGYTGKIRKGMLLSGRFLLAKRSLLALLCDKAEDWLDPRAS